MKTVPVNQTPLDFTENEVAFVDLFVQSLVQLLAGGAGGAESLSPNILPPTKKLPERPLLHQGEEQQKFYRQLALATIKSMSAAFLSSPPTNVAKTYPSDEFVKAGAGVYLRGDGLVESGDHTSDTESNIIGVALTDQMNGRVPVVVAGTCPGVIWGAMTGVEYFLGPTNGRPVLFSAIPVGARLVRLGIASSPTDLEVRIIDYGVR